MTLQLPAGAGLYGTEPSLSVNRTVGIVPNVLAKSEITNWWWFNESLGRTATDSVGNNDGTLTGGMKWGADAVEGTSVQFEKTGHMMDLGLIDSTLTKVSVVLLVAEKRRRVFMVWNRSPM